MTNVTPLNSESAVVAGAPSAPSVDLKDRQRLAPPDSERPASVSGRDHNDYSVRVIEAMDRLDEAVKSVLKSSELSFQINENTDHLVVEVREVGSHDLVRQFPPEEIIDLAEFLESTDPATFTEGYLRGLLFDRVI